MQQDQSADGCRATLPLRLQIATAGRFLQRWGQEPQDLIYPHHNKLEEREHSFCEEVDHGI